MCSTSRSFQSKTSKYFHIKYSHHRFRLKIFWLLIVFQLYSLTILWHAQYVRFLSLPPRPFLFWSQSHQRKFVPALLGWIRPKHEPWSMMKVMEVGHVLFWNKAMSEWSMYSFGKIWNVVSNGHNAVMWKWSSTTKHKGMEVDWPSTTCCVLTHKN